MILFTFSVTICDAVKHYIDGLFFFTLCILLSVMMVYKYWDLITKEDLEFSCQEALGISLVSFVPCDACVIDAEVFYKRQAKTVDGDFQFALCYVVSRNSTTPPLGDKGQRRRSSRILTQLCTGSVHFNKYLVVIGVVD
jgi:hypothetical protein